MKSKNSPIKSSLKLIIIEDKKLHQTFDSYRLIDIDLSKYNLQKENGSLWVTYEKKNRKRKLRYDYRLEASVDVVRTNQIISKGTLVTDDYVDFIKIKFTNFYQIPLSTYQLNQYNAKKELIKGKILTTAHVFKKQTPKEFQIKQGDRLVTTLQEGPIIATFYTQALNDAHIGDIISIQKDRDVVFQAKILKDGEARVVE